MCTRKEYATFCTQNVCFTVLYISINTCVEVLRNNIKLLKLITKIKCVKMTTTFDWKYCSRTLLVLLRRTGEEHSGARELLVGDAPERLGAAVHVAAAGVHQYSATAATAATGPRVPRRQLLHCERLGRDLLQYVVL